MDSNADALTLLIILAVFMWEARVIAKNLEGRADQQLQRPTLGAPEPDTRGEQPDRPRRLAGDAHSLSAPATRGLDDIRRDYPAFDVDRFLDSVRLVYEAVVVAFANGDRNVLRELLSREVFDTFSQEIADREERREQVELSFIGLKRTEIVDASVVNGRMQITVDFESALVSTTRNQSGRIVDGNPAQIITARDRWTFTKERAAPGPVWRLAATESPPADDRAAISSEQA
jgi:predicted lipid-binding transport protein (Tim44 family)